MPCAERGTFHLMKQDLLVARLVRAGACPGPVPGCSGTKSFMRQMKQDLLVAQLTAPTVEGRLAEALQAVRQKTGKSLRALELEIYVSDSSLSRYLSGRSVPPWQVVENLCRVAGHPPDDLRPLWEEASRQHRARTAHEPAAGGSQGFTVEASVASYTTGSELSTRCGCCWHRRWAEAGLLAATAMLLVALSMWAGIQLENRRFARLAKPTLGTPTRATSSVPLLLTSRTSSTCCARTAPTRAATMARSPSGRVHYDARLLNRRREGRRGWRGLAARGWSTARARSTNCG